MFPHFTEPGSSLSCWQGFPTVPTQRQMNLIHTRPSCFIKAILILFFHPCIGFASCLFASCVSSKTSLLPFFQTCYVSCALGTFGNCEKRLLASLCLSVSPVACNNSAPTRRIFMKFHIWIFFSKICRKDSSFIEIYKNNRRFTWRSIYNFDHMLLISSYNEKCFRQKL